MGRLLLLAAVAFAPSADPPAELVKRESARLRGNWVLAEIEMGGMRLPVPAPVQGHTRLAFSGDSFTLCEGTGKHDGKYRFTATQGEVDLTVHDATLHALYQVEGETLTLCTAGEARPTALRTTAENGCILQVYCREWPGGAADPAAAQELKRLEGVWEVILPEGVEKPKEGEKLPQRSHLVIRGGEANWVVDGKQAGESGRLWVNPAVKPKILSLQTGDARIDGSYECDGKTLTLRYHALPYGERKVLTLRRVAR